MDLNFFDKNKSYKYLRIALSLIQTASTLCVLRKALLTIPKFPLATAAIVGCSLTCDIYRYYYQNPNNTKFNLDYAWFAAGLLASAATLCSPNRTLGFITWAALVKPVGSAPIGEIDDLVSTGLCIGSGLLAQLPIPYIFPIISFAMYSINSWLAFRNMLHIANDRTFPGRVATFGVNLVFTVGMPLSAALSALESIEILKPKIKWLKDKTFRVTDMRSEVKREESSELQSNVVDQNGK